MLKQSVREIAPFTWCISEFGLVNAFAAAGNERAAVIDTCCGYGNIREIAEKITSRPLIVILTHKHPDHAGGIFHFRDCPVYMNGLDKDLVFPGMGFDNAFRKMYLDTRGPLRCPDVMKDVYSLIPESEPDMTFSFTHAEDGMRIDLGGRVLEVIHTPGHTDGSISLLDEDNRILFSGDTVNKSIILMRQKNNSPVLIERFHNTLEKIWSHEKAFDHLAIGHDGDLIDKGIVHDYLCLSSGLLDGSITGHYEEKGFRKGDVARLGKAELWYQCDC